MGSKNRSVELRPNAYSLAWVIDEVAVPDMLLYYSLHEPRRDFADTTASAASAAASAIPWA